MSEQVKKKRHARKYQSAVIVGAVTVLLAVIGLFTVLSACYSFGQRFLDNSGEKEKFEKILFPIVMFDPAPCESVNEIDDIIMLRNSIWSAYVSNIEKYSLDASKRGFIAKSDVDVACAKLFGPEITLTHQSFSDYMNTYYFDDSKEAYRATFDSSSVRYTPQVEEVDKSGDIYSLYVGYLESGNQWLNTIYGRDYEPAPDKYMVYTLKKVNDHFQLLSIQYPEDGAVPGKPVYDNKDPNTAPPQTTDEPLPTEQTPTEETPTPTEGENSGITV